VDGRKWAFLSRHCLIKSMQSALHLRKIRSLNWGSWCRIAEYSDMRDLQAKLNAVEPVRTSYAKIPIAKTSALSVISGEPFYGVSARLPGWRTTSGAMYSGVPAKPRRPPDSGLTLTAKLKSVSLTEIFPLYLSIFTDTLLDLRSRCKMFFVCRNSSARRIYRTICMAWFSVKHLTR